MARLINADALKKALRDCQIESLIAHTEKKNVFDIIDEQPTAYDVDAVIKELEEYRNMVTIQARGFVKTAINIVKDGGKNE